MIGASATFWITILALLTQKYKISFIYTIAYICEIYILSLAEANAQSHVMLTKFY